MSHAERLAAEGMAIVATQIGNCWLGAWGRAPVMRCTGVRRSVDGRARCCPQECTAVVGSCAEVAPADWAQIRGGATVASDACREEDWSCRCDGRHCRRSLSGSHDGSVRNSEVQPTSTHEIAKCAEYDTSLPIVTDGEISCRD